MRVKPKRQASQTHVRTFWKCSVVGCGSPTAINLRKSRRAFAKPYLIAQSRTEPRAATADYSMREIVIVALACFLIGIMATALIVQLVP